MNVAWASFWGGNRSTKPSVFFRVKWLQPTMKGTSSVRRVRLGPFRTRSVQPLRCAMSGCVCVRSSMRFLKLWLQITNGCMNVAWALFWGGSRSTKPCIFLSKVASAGNEKYLLRGADAVWIVSRSIGSSFVFCNEWFFLCA